MRAGDQAFLEIGYSGYEARPDMVDYGDRAVFVRYGVTLQSGELVSRFINEALILPADPASAPGRGESPRGSRLEECVPNPFSTSTMLIYRLEAASEVTLSIYDVGGRQVSEIREGMKAPGTHGAKWTARDSRGHKLPAGLYLVVMQAGDTRSERKIVIAQ